MRFVAYVGRIGLLGLLLCVAACGSAETEKALAGTWFGPSLDGQARRLDLDSGGRVHAYSVNGNPTGLTGFIKHLHGLYYEVEWKDEEGETFDTAAFLLSTTGEHAAFYDPSGSLAALQRGADTWNPDGYTLDDIAPVYCTGDTWFLDLEGVHLGDERSQMDVFGDAGFEGEDTGGRLFQSPAGTSMEVLNGERGIFRGAYEDQFRATNADLTLLMTPDKLFVVGFANWDPWTFTDGWTATWELQDVVVPAEE